MIHLFITPVNFVLSYHVVDLSFTIALVKVRIMSIDQQNIVGNGLWSIPCWNSPRRATWTPSAKNAFEFSACCVKVSEYFSTQWVFDVLKTGMGRYIYIFDSNNMLQNAHFISDSVHSIVELALLAICLRPHMTHRVYSSTDSQEWPYCYLYYFPDVEKLMPKF